MVAFLIVAFLVGLMATAKADCLHDIGQFREQVDLQNRTRPTAQSQAAAREIQKLERSESADEIDCVNTLVKVRQMLASPIAPTGDDRYAKDRHE